MSVDVKGVLSMWRGCVRYRTIDGPVGLRVVGAIVGAREGEEDDGRDVGCREGSLVGRTVEDDIRWPKERHENKERNVIGS